MDNPFWEYSTTVYGCEGVADTCIALQDSHGLDVNLLLYAGWLASQGRGLPDTHLALLQAEIGTWRDTVVEPLRALRRQLTDYPPAAEIRGELLALELHAEREQQGKMYRLFVAAGELPAAALALEDNLRCVARASGAHESLWDAQIAHLGALLAPQSGVASGQGG